MKVAKHLIDPKGLAQYLGISIETVYSWTAQKWIPHIKIGRLVRFDEAEIEKWLADRKQPGSKYADDYWRK